MIFLGIPLGLAAIVLFCWLLFTLAVFVLPFFAAVSAGTWAYNTGAGWLGAIVFGLIAGGVTLGIGQVLLVIVRPMWARFLVALVFVAPAVFAGYHATLGIAKLAMSSETWQIVFSIIGAVAIGITTLLRVASIAPGGQSRTSAWWERSWPVVTLAAEAHGAGPERGT